MASDYSSSALQVFGPFEVNARTGELTRRGRRVRLSGQPFQILLLLLTRPADLVTRDELRDRLWGEGTFVDFEHGLNAAINKLRRALGDSAEHPQYIETVPGRGYRFIGTLEVGPEAVRPPHAPPVPEERKDERRSARWWQVAAVACLAAGLLLAAALRPSSAPTAPWTFTRITSDPGFSDDPALSPDGSLIAYASDRAALNGRDPLAGGLDLYMRHVAGGSPIRLTFDGAGNTMPDFSPDGSRIVFRSSRDGGGIYEMPALGGSARLIVRDGLNPRYSPDGRQVAYWIGSPTVSAAVAGSGSVWVVSVGGGPPRRVGPHLSAARHPIWHKAGQHLLMVGYTSSKAFDRAGIDWWVVATDGSSAVRTGTYEALVGTGLGTDGNTRTPVPGMPEPRCWSPDDDAVTFSTPRGDSWNLWEIVVSSRRGSVVGLPQRLTTGAGTDLHASCASGGVRAFAKVEARTDLWLLPFDLTRGTAAGVPERITEGPSWHENPSLTPDGRFVAFTSDQSGRGNVWMRDLGTGSEMAVSASPLVQRFPVSNAAGDRVAFSTYENAQRNVYVSAPGGAPEKLCDGCLRATAWSRDDSTLLVFGGDPYHISTLDISSRRQAPLVRHPDYGVLYGRFSPDERWISFTARVQPARGRIVVAPVDGPRPIPERHWVTVADVGSDDYAHWSPDGKTLYFTSGRDGYACLWGQRIDTGSGRPVGDVFAVHHLHGRLSFGHGGWSATAGRIAMPLLERTGNLWMMSRTPVQ